MHRIEEERDILKNPWVLGQGARMKHRFVNEHRDQNAISSMPHLLCIARAGFYAWIHQPVSIREQEDQWLLELIRYS